MSEPIIENKEILVQEVSTSLAETTKGSIDFFSNKEGFELIQRMAKALTLSTVIPDNYQGNLSNCIIAIELAARMKLSPLLVMQNLVIIYGKPGWYSTFIISQLNSSGKFVNGLEFETREENGEIIACRAVATSKRTGKILRGAEVTMIMARAEGWVARKGSKWVTMAEQMIHYRAATFFARVHAPECIMGMQSTEEIQDSIEPKDITPPKTSGVEKARELLEKKIAVEVKNDIDDEFLKDYDADNEINS